MARTTTWPRRRPAALTAAGLLLALSLSSAPSSPQGFSSLEDMVLVPGGPFPMGTEDQNENEGPVHSVLVDSFYIDRYEVTVGQYRACLEDGACHPQPRIGGKCNWWKPGRQSHPMNCIDWHEAVRFCRWAGKRLPSEAEWEKAARGADLRPFPWGDKLPTCVRAVMDDGCGDGRTSPVGSLPEGVSPCGAHDMAGNVGEWVADWYQADYYRHSPETAPTGPDSTGRRVLRGGSWRLYSGFLRTTHRYSSPPSLRHDDVGFRCARGRR